MEARVRGRGRGRVGERRGGRKEGQEGREGVGWVASRERRPQGR